MSATDEKIWEKPDQRIQWALDILDDGGYEQTPIVSYFWYPVLFGSSMGLGNPIRNMLYRRPMNTALHLTIAGAATGWFFGCWWRNRLARKNADELAVIRHYMMLHPEKFPEPEKKKFGDKEVFLEWPINR